MAHSAKSQFGDSELLGPLIRFAAAPLAVVLAFEMPLVFLTGPKQISAFLVVGLIELICAAFIVGAWSTPRTGRVAFRTAAGLVSLFYLAVVCGQLTSILAPALDPFPHVKQWDRLAWIPSFCVVGLPCMWYAVFGRFLLTADDALAKRPKNAIVSKEQR